MCQFLWLAPPSNFTGFVRLFCSSTSIKCWKNRFLSRLASIVDCAAHLIFSYHLTKSQGATSQLYMYKQQNKNHFDRFNVNPVCMSYRNAMIYLGTEICDYGLSGFPSQVCMGSLNAMEKPTSNVVLEPRRQEGFSLPHEIMGSVHCSHCHSKMFVSHFQLYFAAITTLTAPFTGVLTFKTFSYYITSLISNLSHGCKANYHDTTTIS